MSKAVPLPAPSSWDSNALFAKAQRYVEQMLQCDRAEWQFGLWSSLSLELLARAALAKLSPVLLADAKDWNNLYHALGHNPTVPKFTPKSIAVTDVLARLGQINAEFTKDIESFCVVHVQRRNAEVHSGETPFDGVSESEWLPSFYRACSVLLNSLGRDLKGFVGADEADVAEKLIKAAADKAAKEVAGDIKAHAAVWSKKEKKVQEDLATQASVWAARRLGHVVDCPACKSKSLVTGDPVASPSKTIKGDVITETQQFLPSRFECIACGLKISGLAQLSEAGLGSSFKRTSTYDAASYYAPDAEPEDYEDDNNEPF